MKKQIRQINIVLSFAIFSVLSSLAIGTPEASYLCSVDKITGGGKAPSIEHVVKSYIARSGETWAPKQVYKELNVYCNPSADGTKVTLGNIQCDFFTGKHPSITTLAHAMALLLPNNKDAKYQGELFLSLFYKAKDETVSSRYELSCKQQD